MRRIVAHVCQGRPMFDTLFWYVLFPIAMMWSLWYMLPENEKT